MPITIKFRGDEWPTVTPEEFEYLIKKYNRIRNPNRKKAILLTLLRAKLLEAHISYQTYNDYSCGWAIKDGLELLNNPKPSCKLRSQIAEYTEREYKRSYKTSYD